MIEWQSEHSFDLMPKTNVLLMHALYFVNQSSTKTVITELLVGLDLYIQI
uniref:Uncharacterized protein n=1 Tax=Nelumbo nucifera TaxID=4432 RepID=A0A822XR30_NELNU|nr:TPA_asm: hypothetical protein HUJ06_025517 [Nelumbo nucifera]